MLTLRRLWPYLLAVLLYVLLHLGGGFSLRQSAFLAAILTIVFADIARRVQRSPLRFYPFWILVEPHWAQILRDFNLISSPEQLEDLKRLHCDVPAHEYAPLRDPVSLSVFRYGQDLEHVLVYDFFARAFTSEITFRTRLKPMFGKKRDAFGGYFIWFWIRPGAKGHELGLRLPPTWREENPECHPDSCFEEQDFKVQGIEGDINFVLAIIPYEELNGHLWPREYDLKYSLRIWNAQRKVREEQHWTNKEDKYCPITTTILEHRYFTVSHGRI
jgi:hypothetical protein